MTREEEAQELLDAYLAEIKQLSTNYRRIAHHEDLPTARAILDATPSLQAAVVRLAQRLPFQRTSYALNNLSFQLHKRTQSVLPTLIEQGVLRKLPEQQGEILFRTYRSELEQAPGDWDLRPATLPSGRAILEADPSLQIVVIRLLTRHSSSFHHPTAECWLGLRALLAPLYKRHLPYTLEDIQVIVRTWAALEYPPNAMYQALLRALSYSLTNPDMLAACQLDLAQLRSTASTWYAGADHRKFLKLLDEILAGQQKRSVTLCPDEWGRQVMVLLEAMEPDLRTRWLALLDHCAAAKGSAPGRKWLAQVPRFVDTLGSETFCRLVIAWIDAFGKQRGARLEEENATLLKGLA